MRVDELEEEALKLDPRSRARLAERLLASLEDPSATENERVWADEAVRRDAEIERNPGAERLFDEALRDIRGKLRRGGPD